MAVDIGHTIKWSKHGDEYSEEERDKLRRRYPELFKEAKGFWKSPFGLDTLRKNFEQQNQTTKD